MNLQVLTLLTTIVAVISSLLSLNQKLSKIGVIGLLKILSYYILPILFIQQIIQITYSIKSFMIIIFSVLPILFLAFAIKLRKKNVFDRDEKVVIGLLISAVFLLWIKPVFLNCVIPNYFDITNKLYTDLFNYKISEEMYVFLCKNLTSTFLILLDTVTYLVYAIVEVISIKYYMPIIFSQFIDQNHMYCNFRKVAKGSLSLVILSSGIVHYFVYCIMKLF